MPESLGARLRQRREERHVSLSAIAEQTKISLPLLAGLERDDVSRWPSGIFRRAFMRAYAEAVGLEPDEVLRDFLAEHPDPAEALEPLSALASQSSASLKRPPSRFGFALGSALGSLSPRRTPAPTRSVPLDEVAVAADRGPAAAAPAADRPPAAASAAPRAPDLAATARLCTELARAGASSEVTPLVAEAARLLDAPGLIIWKWNPQAAELTPALAHGYSDKVLAQLPRVPVDADNLTAAAFRDGEIHVVNGRERSCGALAIPILAPGGCVGVLAIELRCGCEQETSTRALATILAAQMARFVDRECPAQAERRLA